MNRVRLHSFKFGVEPKLLKFEFNSDSYYLLHPDSLRFGTIPSSSKVALTGYIPKVGYNSIYVPPNTGVVNLRGVVGCVVLSMH